MEVPHARAILANPLQNAYYAAREDYLAVKRQEVALEQQYKVMSAGPARSALEQQTLLLSTRVIRLLQAMRDARAALDTSSDLILASPSTMDQQDDKESEWGTLARGMKFLRRAASEREMDVEEEAEMQESLSMLTEQQKKSQVKRAVLRTWWPEYLKNYMIMSYVREQGVPGLLAVIRRQVRTDLQQVTLDPPLPSQGRFFVQPYIATSLCWARFVRSGGGAPLLPGLREMHEDGDPGTILPGHAVLAAFQIAPLTREQRRAMHDSVRGWLSFDKKEVRIEMDIYLDVTLKLTLMHEETKLGRDRVLTFDSQSLTLEQKCMLLPVPPMPHIQATLRVDKLAREIRARLGREASWPIELVLKVELTDNVSQTVTESHRTFVYP